MTCHGLEAIITTVDHSPDRDKDYPTITQAKCNTSGCTTTKVDNNVSYFDGFYCGGRMGYYWCQDTGAYVKNPKREFLQRSCAPHTPGCPARITAD